MEAASRGAVESGGRALGIPCDIFESRSPNEYLTEAMHSPDLHDRARKLVESSSGFVILRGKAGTLHELSLLWALHRAGCLAGRPVVLLGGRWRELLDYLGHQGILERPQLEISEVADTAEQAVELLSGRIHPRKDGE
jgi:predicted Rossmann-fold nucleotide-binding protein